VGTADMEAMKSALSVADRIVIPVPPSQADIWSTQRFLSLIAKITAEKAPQVCVFVNRADTHHSIRESDEAEEALGELDGVTLIKNRLHQRTAYRRSFSEGVGVFELVPWSKASKEFKTFAGILYPETRERGGN
jgi:chromosome partitioning protein